MGYHTDFEGQFSVTPELKPEHMEYLKKFAETRRFKRNAWNTAKRADPYRKAAKLGLGVEGGYFVNEEGMCGQNPSAPDCFDYNSPPKEQPSLWCQWVPTEDGNHIEWDGGEKFYDYVPWIKYLVEHFLKPWGYKLNGSVEWRGEDFSDQGTIYAKDNDITTSADQPAKAKPKKAKKAKKENGPTLEQVKQHLHDILDDFDTEGCDGVGVVGIPVINKARKLLGMEPLDDPNE